MTNTNDLLTRRVENILPSKEAFQKLLDSGKKIRLYQGFDPSAPHLHVGHLVGLLQLKAFQDAGHEVIFLIGDFTGMIGDPTDKSATRSKLTREQVLENAKTYKDQAGKILNFDGDNPAQIKFNADWLNQMNFADVIELSSNITVQQLLERDMFQQRIKDQKPIHLHEMMYPMLQGYDSVAMDVDLEVGGNDQLFNMMVGRHLLKTLKGKEKFVLTTKLLADSSGAKIGKTTGNAINLFGDPKDLYGQVMALSDDVVIPAYTLATTVSGEEINKQSELLRSDPMLAKKNLASTLVTLCHSEAAAQQAADHFQQTVQSKQAPADITQVTVDQSELSILELCKITKVGESSGQIKRTIQQGGVEFAGTKITDQNQTVSIKDGEILKFGKRTYIKISKK